MAFLAAIYGTALTMPTQATFGLWAFCAFIAATQCGLVAMATIPTLLHVGRKRSHARRLRAGARALRAFTQTGGK
jgi:hypothetical protein